MKGIFVDDELKGLGLNPAQKMVVSIYKYYTENGGCKCCTMSNEDIADAVEIGVATVKRIKKDLKDMNLIRTDGGIRVYYLGVRGAQNDTVKGAQNDTKVAQNDTGGAQNDTKVAQNDTGGAQNDTHNKEKRIKKEIKKKGTSQSQPGVKAGPARPSGGKNFDIILDMIPAMTPDKESFLRNKIPGYIEKINAISCFDETSKNSYLKMINSYLNTHYDNPLS